MKIIAILLIVVGVFGIFAGMMMVGDIGIAALLGASAGLLSGIGFWKVAGTLNELGDE